MGKCFLKGNLNLVWFSVLKSGVGKGFLTGPDTNTPRFCGLFGLCHCVVEAATVVVCWCTRCWWSTQHITAFNSHDKSMSNIAPILQADTWAQGPYDLPVATVSAWSWGLNLALNPEPELHTFHCPLLFRLQELVYGGTHASQSLVQLFVSLEGRGMGLWLGWLAQK